VLIIIGIREELTREGLWEAKEAKVFTNWGKAAAWLPVPEKNDERFILFEKEV
jgi:hypothetical protein